MNRYIFSVRSERAFEDTDGLELPDLEAVRAEALGFARDLMRLQTEWRDWSNAIVHVTDENQNTVLDLSFADAARN
jgi:hypothetical protein